VIGGTLVTTGALGGYWTVATWLPTLLKTVRGLSVLNTSGYVIVVTAGAFIGFLIGGYLGDLIGRRWSMMLMAVCSAALVYTYTLIPISNELMLGSRIPTWLLHTGDHGHEWRLSVGTLPDRSSWLCPGIHL
jgi:predicted MFS family arabinose efflux permease